MSPRSLFALVIMGAATYLFGLALGRLALVSPSSHAQPGRLVLTMGIVALIGALVVYKYDELFSVVFSKIVHTGPLVSLNLLLPLGMSFWTFQAVAYLVDIYRGRTAPVKNPFMFALAVSFFPVVTSGPITRVQILTEQFARKHTFDYDGMRSGMLLIGLGFFKKLMIADRLSVFVNTVFDNPRIYTASSNGLLLFVGATFFAIQLYCDFSGYTDIVRGSARIFGVELPLNFRAPYFSKSVREFWRRWHMSLMDWLRDYLYIPLGGNRKGKLRKHLNTVIVFGVSGLWHGTGLTYLAWGLLNGFYTILGELLEPINDRVVGLLHINRHTVAHRIFQTLATFVLITISWVFFRANNLSDALYIVRTMFSPTVWIFTDNSMVQQGLTYSELLIALASIGVLGVMEWLSLRKDLLASFRRQSLVYRWVAYYALVLSIVVFGSYGGAYDASNFLYFKF